MLRLTNSSILQREVLLTFQVVGPVSFAEFRTAATWDPLHATAAMNPESTVRPGAVTPGGALLIGWSTAFIFLATVAVALRFKSRRLNHEVGADDWTMLAGLVFAYGQYITTAVLTCVVGFGGYQRKDLSISQFERFLFVRDIFATVGPPLRRTLNSSQYQWLDIILWALTLPTIKFSILLLYRRTFPIQAFVRLTWVVGAIILSWEVATVVAEIFTCTPVQASWKPDLAEHCINAKSFYLGNTVSNLLTDVIVMCLPMPIIWGLHMSTKRKASVSAVFLLGTVYVPPCPRKSPSVC